MTSSVISMNGMFSSCSSLEYLDFPNIQISSETNMESMFYNCEKLEYINLYSYNEPETGTLINNNILDNTPEDIVICVNKNNNFENLQEIINTKSSAKISCGDEEVLTTQMEVLTTEATTVYVPEEKAPTTDIETQKNTEIETEQKTGT